MTLYNSIGLCRKEPATPVIPFLGDKNLVRKRIVVAGCYRGYMVFIVVYYIDDFEDCELEGGFHILSGLGALGLSPRI